MPKTHKHLFEQIVSLPNLFGAARDALRGKRSRSPAASFFADLEGEVVTLRDELESETYQHGAYHYFTIHEPKERMVAAAPFRDRVVHHAIVRVLTPIFEPRFISDSFACRKGKGTHAALERAAEFTRQYRYALKCDVRKYFPSVDHEVLQQRLARVIADDRALDLIGRVLASHRDGTAQEWGGADLFSVAERPRGLPIGNLTSQFLANVYLDPLDHFVKEELRVKGYVRYVDDFLLFHDERAVLRDWGNRVREKLAELRLEIHPDKYRLQPTRCGVDFVGFVCFANGRRRIRSTNVRRFTLKFRAQQREVMDGKLAPSDLTQSVRAWIAHAAHAQSWGLRTALLSGK